MREASASGFAVAVAMLLLIEATTQIGAQPDGSNIRVPPVFNVARNKSVVASATCGVDDSGNSISEQFCLLTLSQSSSATASICDICQGASGPRAYPAQRMIDGSDEDWVSPPLSRGEKYHEVNVTIDLGQIFHVAYVLVTAKRAPRPGHWILEKSLDNRVYTPWQYFVQNDRDCEALYGIDPKAALTDSSPRCTDSYSAVTPLNNGEVYARLLNGRPNTFSDSPELQEFTSARYIRLRLLRITTLLGELLIPSDYQDAILSRRYFYSIDDIQVGGRCKCNGFASECIPRGDRLVCQCVGNTCGADCSQCCLGYNQYKWQQRTQANSFTCQRCNCFGHSDDCVYDAQVDADSTSINLAGQYSGGGVCQNCRDNTAGINCHECASKYFRRSTQPRTDACTPCLCTGPGSLDGTCNPSTGRCVCKKNVEGFYCDRCKPGYFGLEAGNPDGCSPCGCNVDGSLVGLTECGTHTTGACACKPLVTSPTCGRCISGAFGLDGEKLFGCDLCLCNVGGSTDPFGCNSNKGKCSCRSNIAGKKCDQISSGFYLPSFHTTFFVEAEEGTLFSFRTPFAFNETIFPGFSGFGYVILRRASQEMIAVTFSVPQEMKYRVAIYYLLEGSEASSIQAYFNSRGQAEQAVTISLPASNSPQYSDLYGSNGDFILSAGEWTLTIEYKSASRLLIDRILLLPEEYYSPTQLVTNVPDMCRLEQADNLCRSYTYPSLTQFSSQAGVNGASRPTPFYGQLVAKLDVDEDEIGFIFQNVPPGTYAVAVSYFSSHVDLQRMTVEVSGATQQGIIDIYPCMFSFGCRHIAMDRGQVLGFDVNSSLVTVTLRLSSKADRSEIAYIDTVYLIPLEKFYPSMVTPTFNCFISNSTCLQTRFKQMENSAQIAHYSVADDGYSIDSVGDRQDVAVSSDSTLNSFSQSTRGVAVLNPSQKSAFVEVSLPSRSASYDVVFHYYNPSAEPVTLSLLFDDVARNVTLPFCPDKSGCRVSLSGGTFSSSSFTLTMTNEADKDVFVDSVSFVRSDSFDGDDFTQPKPVDLKNRFITECSQNAFEITTESSAFCRESVSSLSAIFNDGALQCNCNPDGSESPVCSQTSGACQCKPDVVGFTCSRCKVGFYGFPDCKPCGCASGSICNDVTGDCTCPPNVIGRRCNQCEPGYWDFDALRGCIDCECDPAGSKSTECDAVTGECQCKKRFHGLKCNACAEGRYGPPSCRDCNCNAAGSVGVSCDQSTAECQCKTNVQGPKCSQCKPGYFNFTALNPDGCALCNCNLRGSVDSNCNLVTGQCTCKEGVVGLKCDQCDVNKYQVLNGSCTPCNCHPQGAESDSCNPENGKCDCRRFVRGRQCNRCLRGHYALSTSGCTSCQCDPLGSTGICNETSGMCECKAGAFGARCDQCKARFVVSDDGCRPCGYCTDSIMDNIEDLVSIVNGTLLNITDYSFLVAAWRRLRMIEREFNRTQFLLCGRTGCGDLSVIPPPPPLVGPPPTGGSRTMAFVDVLRRLDNLIGRMDPDTGLVFRLAFLQVDIGGLELRVNVSLDDGIETRNIVTKLRNRANDLLNQTKAEQDALRNTLAEFRNFVDSLSDIAAGGQANVTVARDILNKLQQKDFEMPLKRANQLNDEAEKIFEIAEEAAFAADIYLRNATAIQGKVRDWVKLLREAKELAGNASQKVNATAVARAAVEDILSDFEEKVAGLQSHIEELKKNMSKTGNQSAAALKQLENALNVQMCAQDNTSQMVGDLKRLRQDVYDFMGDFADIQVEALIAERNASRFASTAKQLKKIWEDASADFEDSVEYLRNYDLINVTDFLLNLTLSVNTSSNATFEAEKLSISDLIKRTKESLNRSQALFQEAMDCSNKLKDLNSSLSDLLANLESVRGDLQDTQDDFAGTNATINQLASRAPNDATNAQKIASAAAKRAAEQRGNITAYQNEAELLKNRVDNLLGDTAPVLEALSDAEKSVSNASATVMGIQNDSKSLNKAFANLTARLDQLDIFLEDIEKKIKLFRDHASTINIPMGLNPSEDEAITVVPPPSMKEPNFLTSVSMNVRAGEDSGLLLFIGPDTKDGNARRRKRRGLGSSDPFFAIEANGGTISSAFSVGGPVAVMEIRNGLAAGSDTYQIEAKRLGLTGQLSVKSLTAPGSTVQNGEATIPDPSLPPWFDFGENPQIFIGGIPDDYQMPSGVASFVGRTKFSGCIVSLNVNEELVSLANFENATTRVPPVCRSDIYVNEYVAPGAERGSLSGLGYVAVDPTKVDGIKWSDQSKYFSIQFDQLITTQRNGLLFYASGDGGVFLSLEIRDGGLRALLHNGDELFDNVIPDIVGLSQSVPGVVSLRKQGADFVLNAHSESSSVKINRKDITLSGPFYFGGVPRNLKIDASIDRSSLRGCLSKINLVVGDSRSRGSIELKPENVLPESNGYGDTCPDRQINSAYFDGKGGAIYRPLTFSSSIAFILNPVNETGTLLHQTQTEAGKQFYYTVTLRNKQIQFFMGSFDDGDGVDRSTATSTNQVTLGSDNFVSIIREDDRVTINLNQVETQESGFLQEDIVADVSDVDGYLLVGGARKGDSVIAEEFQRRNQVLEYYQGCLKEVAIDSRLLSFTDADSAESSGIMAPCGAEAAPTVAPTPTAAPKPTRVSTPTPFKPSCVGEPQLEQNAFSFDGMAGSRLEYQFTDKKIVQKGFEIRFSIRTDQEEAEVMSVANGNQKSYVLVTISGGKIVYKFYIEKDGQENDESKEFSVESSAAINDGQWHDILLTRNLKAGSLSVDGGDEINGRFSGDAKNLGLEAAFIFGDRDNFRGRHKPITKLADFQGCIKDVSIESVNGGKTPVTFDDTVLFGGTSLNCYKAVETTGDVAGFNGNSHVIVAPSWDVSGGMTAKMSARSNIDSGLLISVGGDSDTKPGSSPSYVVLEIRNGLLHFVVNNGEGEYSVSDGSQTSLCDGEWHSVEARLTRTTIEINVDGQGSTTSLGADSTNDSQGPLYVGGLPNGVSREARHVTAGNLNGCIRDLFIDGDRSFEAVDTNGGATVGLCNISQKGD